MKEIDELGLVYDTTYSCPNPGMEFELIDRHVYPHPINIRDGDQVHEWDDEAGHHTEVIRKDGTVEVVE